MTSVKGPDPCPACNRLYGHLDDCGLKALHDAIDRMARNPLAPSESVHLNITHMDLPECRGCSNHVLTAGDVCRECAAIIKVDEAVTPLPRIGPVQHAGPSSSGSGR